MSRIRSLVLLVTFALIASQGGAAYAAPARFPLPVDGPPIASAPETAMGMSLWQQALIAVVVAVGAFVAGARVGRHRAVATRQPRVPVSALG
jgi:hypothetical protein